MSLSLVQSRALLGLEAAAVTVEVHLANGLPSFTLVGLADVEVKEARERVRCGAPEQRPRVPAQQAHHGQPGAGRPAQGVGPLRPADRAGHPGGQRPDRWRRGWPATSSPASCRCPASCGRCAVRWRWRWRCTAGGIATRAGAAGGQRRGGRAGAGRAGLSARATCSTWCAQFLPAGAAPPRPRRRLGARCVPRRRRPAAAPDLARRQGPGRRQARARDRGGRRPQPADGRPARHRQVDAGAALRRPAAARMSARRGAGKRGRSPAWPARFAPERWGQRPTARAAPHAPARWRWSAAARRRGRARSRWRTTACCSSTSCPSSRAPRSRRCASRWRPAASRSRAPRGGPSSRRASSWSRR